MLDFHIERIIKFCDVNVREIFALFAAYFHRAGCFMQAESLSRVRATSNIHGSRKTAQKAQMLRASLQAGDDAEFTYISAVDSGHAAIFSAQNPVAFSYLSQVKYCRAEASEVNRTYIIYKL